MKRFEVTTLFNLNRGDRFYKLGQKAKTVFQVELKQLNMHNELSEVVVVDPYHKKNDKNHKTDFDVVFLFNVEEGE